MPTQKQKLVATKIVENRGNISKSMREAGYSRATAKNPMNLTRSKGWSELMEKDFPDKLLTRQHHKLLTKKEFVVIGRGKNREVFSTKQIDADAVARGLDMAYKLKNKYPKGQIEISILSELKDKTDDELKQIAGIKS